MASPEKINRINSQWRQQLPDWEQETSSIYRAGPEVFYDILGDDENVEIIAYFGWPPGLEDARYHRGPVVATDQRILFACSGRCPEFEEKKPFWRKPAPCNLVSATGIPVLSLSYQNIEILTDNSYVYARTEQYGDLYKPGVNIHSSAGDYKITDIHPRTELLFVNCVWHHVAMLLRAQTATGLNVHDTNTAAKPVLPPEWEIPTSPTDSSRTSYRDMLAGEERE